MEAPPPEPSVVDPVPGCLPEIGASLWTLEESRRRTLAYVADVGVAALDHTPNGHRHSVATLLYHIAVFEADWLYIDILGSEYDMDRRIPKCPPHVSSHLMYPLLLEDGRYPPVSGEPLSVHFNRLAAVRTAFLEVVGAMDLDDFRTLRPSGDEQVTPEFVVEHLALHEAEHRGQIWEARTAAETELGLG